MSVFVDTGVFYALHDEDADRHRREGVERRLPERPDPPECRSRHLARLEREPARSGYRSDAERERTDNRPS